MSLLEIKNLHLNFGDKNSSEKALKGVSMRLDAGKSLGLVGESGSGKTITSLSIMRLLDETECFYPAGEILYNGVDLLSLPEEEIRKYRGGKIGMIFQEPMTSLNPVYTCGDQVSEILELHKNLSKAQAKERVLELFEEVQLPEPPIVFKKYPHQLSGGQKQRVMIAMAIACKPELLIADEPTTALDVTVQKTILNLLTNLCEKRGMAMIFISHDLGVINAVADDVAVMKHGELVEIGKVADIFNNPQHPYTRGLIACRPNPDLSLRRLPTVSDFLEAGKILSLKEVIEPLKIGVKPENPQRKSGSEPLLKVKNLVVSLPIKTNIWGRATRTIEAVNDVSFDVFEGEIVGLVGESGCGKTTLSRTLLNLMKPTSGEIFWKGQRIDNLGKAEWKKLRRDVQIIFQDPFSSLNPAQSVGKSIIEPMIVHGIGKNNEERKALTKELLAKVKLDPEMFDRLPHQFSGGQRQRIGIARALAVQPKFIICDESVSALDVSVQATVLNLLLDLKDEFNLTYIFISHDLSVVKFIADHLLVMRKGKIVEQGKSSEVYEKPSETYTQSLIEAIPKLEV
jgi:peptide/nickel transport system ATP-binding protein